MILIVLIICVTLGYTVFVGYNDGSNAIATSIATRAISHRTAVIINICATVLSPLSFYLFGMDFSVAETIGGTVDSGTLFSERNDNLAYAFIFAGVLSGLLWCLFSAKNKLPVSTSHSLLGGIAGAGVAAFGFAPLAWDNLLLKVVLTSVAVPACGFAVAYFIMRIVKRAAYKVPVSSDGVIKKLQAVNVAVLSASIAINNVQKPLGVMLLMFAVTGFACDAGGVLFISVIVLAVLALTLGTCLGGTRIIHTVGKKIYKIKPIHSFLAQTSVEVVIFAASGLGIPVSAGQAVSSTVMGVGASDRFASVNWLNSVRIFVFWVLTFPITFAFAAFLFLLLKIFV
ncbi:MAG: inorganic phosphate transporter [Clostridiales bacterium]|jgi:PiT family inorganic phosphate transporter|nr:inorganic phosphate transporter [Clostridiales bacterium]